MNGFTTIEEIDSEIARIWKLKGSEYYTELQDFCSFYRYDHPLVSAFFMENPYTNKQCIIASMMYSIYGINAYKTIKQVFPVQTGKQFSSWDDFILDQADKICDFFEPDNNNSDRLSRFLEDLELICDDALYIEIMCRISRNEYSHGILDAKDYIIDYDYFQGRKQTLCKSVYGMRRYVELLTYLVPYDYFGAFKAWGEFYYYFEDVYEKNLRAQNHSQGKSTMYFCKLNIIQLKIMMKKRIINTLQIKRAELIHT